MRRPADGRASQRISSRDPDSFRRALMPDGRATRLGRPLGRRARGVGWGYSGHPGVTVQLQLTAECVAIGCCGVMATNPMSLIGEFGPENTSLTRDGYNSHPGVGQWGSLACITRLDGSRDGAPRE